MATLRTTYAQFVTTGTTKTLHSGPGKIHAIILTAAVATNCQVTFYDNTAASGNTLLVLNANMNDQPIIIFPEHLALSFTVGLTIVTAANAYAYVLTSA